MNALEDAPSDQRTTPNSADLVDWQGVLPPFADHLAAATERARQLRIGEPWRLAIEQSRLGDDPYRRDVVALAAAWRNRRKTSTVYVFAYNHPVPSSVLDPIVDDAQEACLAQATPRAFAQREGRADSRCLYVGHALRFDRRLREHLGDGARKTSALNLKHWALFPDGPLMLQAYAFADSDVPLARLFEEYLWDTLHPVLGRRGGR